MNKPLERTDLEERRQVFQQELDTLWEKRLIPKTDYIRIGSVYDRHYQQIVQRLHSQQTVKEKEVVILDQPAVIEKTASERIELSTSSGEVVERQVEHSSEAQSDTKAPVYQAEPINEKTQEQIRERNITAVLITGVILLLFGGLIWATSTWGSLNSLLKVFCISAVSVFFAGMAYLAARLKIRQTSFAFLTLASLFVPIALLSASYYQIFGPYLSLKGDGRSLFGFLGGLLCLAIYYKIASRFTSKLFIFIALVTFVITFIFGFNYLAPTLEVLCLLITVFNLLLLWKMDTIRDWPFLAVFRPYFFAFVQFKIFAEGFIVFTLFSSTVIYSISLLLSSLLFLILAVKYKKRYYNFVFSVLFTYGYTHFIYNTILEETAVIAFACLPLIFTALHVWLVRTNPYLGKSFAYTSMTVSLLSFLYINALSYQEHYAQIVLALLIIAAQYIFYADREQKAVYTYPVIGLVNLALVYLGLAFDVSLESIFTSLFLIQVFSYLGFYLFNNLDQLKLYKKGALLYSSGIMVFILLIKFAQMDWLIVSLFLAIVSGLFLLTDFKDQSGWSKQAGPFGFIIALTVSLIILYQYAVEVSLWYEETIIISVHLVGISLIMLMLGYLLRNYTKRYFHVGFLTGQVIAMLAYISVYIGESHPFVITDIMLIVTAINLTSVYLYRKHPLWLAVIFTSFGVYFSLFDLIGSTNKEFITAFCLFASLFFMVVSEVIGRYSESGRTYYFWFSHLVNIVGVILGIGLIYSFDSSPFWYLMPLSLYCFSAVRAKINWEQYSFTYIGFLTLFVQTMLFFKDIQNTAYLTAYAFAISAGIISVLWMLGNCKWKEIIGYYLIPYLHFSIIVYISESFINGFPSDGALVFWIISAVLQLVFAGYLLLKRKWSHAIAGTLFLSFLFFSMYVQTLSLMACLSVLLILAALMTGLSSRWVKGLVVQKGGETLVDFYRIFGLIYLIQLNYQLINIESTNAGLDIGAACLIPLYFLVIRTFTSRQAERQGYLSAALILSLFPYQKILEQFTIPEVIQAEVWILPLLIISSLLLRKLYNMGETTQQIEIGVVAFFFFLLILDAVRGDTLNDALVIGTISLAAILFGFIRRYKSYFLAGIGTILLNIYMNTKSLWGYLPWWLYLIIGGLLLISIASYFEWKKQKENRTSKEILEKNKQRFMKWFHQWK